MLAYNEILKRAFILLDGEPYEVLSSHIFRKQQRKPVNQTKLKHLISGKVIEYSFHQSEKVEEAELSKYPLKFLYQKKDEFWFSRPEDPSDRFAIGRDVIGDRALYLLPNQEYKAVEFDDEVIAIETPIKQTYTVKEAPPNVKGNTAQGGNKVVVLETGLSVNAPLFIEEGDKIEVNTDTGEYVTRVSK
jgi:elongation factor P